MHSVQGKKKSWEVVSRVVSRKNQKDGIFLMAGPDRVTLGKTELQEREEI